MDIIITGKDFHLTPSIKEYIETKAQRLFHIGEPIVQMKFELSVDHGHHKGSIFEVDGWVAIAGNDVHAGAKEEEMHVSIDSVIDKLAAQLRKRKEKRVDRNKQGA